MTPKLIFCLFLSFCALAYGKDATQTQYAIGSEVVVASIRKVQDTCIFGNDLLFMRRVAYMESHDGEDLRSFWNSDKGKNGIWKTTNTMLSAIQSNATAAPAITNLQSQLGVNVATMSWGNGDLAVPLNNVAVSRLFTSLQPPIPLDVNDQANYWVQYYDSSGTAEQFIAASKQMPKCIPPGKDLIFIVDASGSIGEGVFQNVRDFLMTVITSLQEGQNNRVGIVLFSTDATVPQTLTYDLSAAYQVAQTLGYDGGGTNTIAGIETAVTQFQNYGRKDVPLVALLITDGEPNQDPTAAATNLKNLGVNFYTIGVGADAAAALMSWASSPNCMFYYSLNGYAQLAASFPELLNSQICDVSAVIPSFQACLNGFVDQGQYVFYQIPINVSTGVTVKLEMLEGAATLYLSMTTRLPSAADYDFYASANVEFPGQIYISPQQLQTGGATSAIYAAVVGLGPENNFTICNDQYDTVENYTTPAPFTTNSSCISLELIFILDRSESVYPDYYNNNVTQFVLDIANQFVFQNEASAGNPAFARFGVIEFASTASVTIPLGNYSRSNFADQVHSKVAYADEGESNLGAAIMAAYYQFQQSSMFRNRAVIMVVDDIVPNNFQDAKDALNRLENFVSMPMGTIMSGTWGSDFDAYQRLVNFIGNKTSFPSMDTAADGMLDLMDNTYPCTAIPACGAIIFVEEATTAIGQPNKLMFLNLVSKLVNNMEHTPNQRFGLAMYGKAMLKSVELQMFADFNKTLNDAIHSMNDDNYPNSGQTYLTPVFQALNNTIGERLYSSYSVLLMGEIEAVKDINTQSTRNLAKSIADQGTNVYVLDETRKGISTSIWGILTGNAYGHIINGTNASPDLLYATFSQTLIPEFMAKGC